MPPAVAARLAALDGVVAFLQVPLAAAPRAGIADRVIKAVVLVDAGHALAFLIAARRLARCADLRAVLRADSACRQRWHGSSPSRRCRRYAAGVPHALATASARMRRRSAVVSGVSGRPTGKSGLGRLARMTALSSPRSSWPCHR